MEHFWDAVVGVFTAIVGLVMWSFKKHSERIDDMEKRLTEVEKTTAVIESKLDDIHEDLLEIKDGIRQLAKTTH